MRRAFGLAVLLLLAGCNAGFAPGTDPPTEATTAEQPPDRIGMEDGYRHDAALNVTTEDGINETELAAVVARTTARVERLRGVEFRGNVTVKLLSRSEYRARNISFTPEVDRAADIRWEAGFMIGEQTDAGRVIDALFGTAVAGYYLPGPDRIVIVSESGDQIDTRTLAHELVHALQDQRGWRVPSRETFDGRLAGTGLTEGDAAAVTQAYATRCRDEWSCLPVNSSGQGNVSAIVAYQGVYLTFRAPYVAGRDFVQRVREQEGWTAVTAAYDQPPTTTRELLEPGVYPAPEPTLTIPDRSNDTWERYATDRVGQAALHATFWANGLVAREDDRIATDYADPYSQGLVADRLAVYRDGSRDGYVWRLKFANASEASDFADGYRRLLWRLDAESVSGETYVISEGPFADAFRIVVAGDTVTIVNGPTVADLDGIHE